MTARKTNTTGQSAAARRRAAAKGKAAEVEAADEAIKTGQLSDREAMDVLLAELMEK